jgi:hypothetical protein
MMQMLAIDRLINCSLPVPWRFVVAVVRELTIGRLINYVCQFRDTVV